METIKNTKDFKKVYNEKKSIANRLFVLYVFPNGLTHSRIGVSVSKKVGKANVRNKIKRRLKEIFRLNEQSIQKGYDFVVVVRKAANEADFSEIEKGIILLLKKHKLWEDINLE